MEKDTGKVAKATLWYTVSNILLRGVSLFTTPIFTRLLSTADYGIASNFVSWSNIILCFTGLSLTTAVLRGKMEFKEKFKQYLSAVQALGILWCIICCLFMLFSMDFWCRLMSLSRTCVMAMMLYVLTFPSLTFTQIDLRFDYKYKGNVAISIINSLGIVVCSIGLIFLWPKQRYLGRIIGNVLPTIVLGGWLAFRIFFHGKKLVDLKYWKYALKLSLPVIPHSLAMIVLGQIDRILILRFCGESENGIYSFGYSYGILLSVVTNAINDAVQPQMYSMLEKGHEEKIASFSYKLMVLGGWLSILIIGIGPEVLKVLGTEAYFDARWAIAPVVFGAMMQYMYQFYGVVELYSKKTIYMAVGSCLAAFVNYILNIICIPRYGWIAAAHTTFISYGLLMLFHFYMARIAYKKKIYRILPILGITVTIIVIGNLVSYMYQWNPMCRYIFLASISMIIAIYLKNEIKMILGKN